MWLGVFVQYFLCIDRLVLDADNVPMVVPFVHTGMQDIMPIGAKFPRIGKTVNFLSWDNCLLEINFFGFYITNLVPGR